MIIEDNNKDNKIYRLGCDIGGTFTDFILLNEHTGDVSIQKVLTTPSDPSDGVLEGIKKLKIERPDFLEKCKHIIHGTTLVINAIIERKGAKVGLITTKGFRDILEIGSELRYDMYDIFLEFSPPLVPRYLRKEVDERILNDGKVYKELKIKECKAVLGELIDQGAESVAVCLLHSYVNPKHEKAIKKIASEMYPNIIISLSSEVKSEIKEVERTSTVVANAYVKPLIKEYISKLLKDLKLLNFQEDLFIMLSSGGIASFHTAIDFPIRVIESGPAAGALAAAYIGRKTGIRKLFSLDMGGTTAKATLIQEGQVSVCSEYEVARVHRFKKGSGIPLKVSVIDLMEIGAGGGSIAKISPLGLLQVGPESTGADPGPACYSRGGKEPTVTDAALVLGYLNPDYFLGGEMKLDKKAAEDAIENKIAKALRLNLVEAAWGIHDIVSENMATFSKMYLAERGVSTAGFPMVSFGGAGPMHASSLAKKLNLSEILVPPNAGIASALGFLVAPISFDVVRTHRVSLNKADFGEIENVYQEMEEEASIVIKKVGPISGSIINSRSTGMCYIGQGFEVNIPIKSVDFNSLKREDILEAFNNAYKRLYTRIYPDIEIGFVNLRVVAEIKIPLPNLFKPSIKKYSLSSAIKGVRDAYSPYSNSMVKYNVYDRYKLFSGAFFEGPAIIEERECTTVVWPQYSVLIDEFGIIRIKSKIANNFD